MRELTEVEELGWTKEYEKQGYYNENGRVVARWASVAIPSAIIPEDAQKVYMNVNRGQWVISFTHPSFPIVPEGDSCKIIKLAEVGNGNKKESID